MIYIAENIKYDTDGAKVNLPRKIEVNVPKDITDEFEISEFISDAISNSTGFCHKGFSTRLITSDEISEYLKQFGTEVREGDNVELMMDNHKCIEFEDVEYYIPDGSSTKTQHDWSIFDYLVNNFHV